MNFNNDYRFELTYNRKVSSIAVAFMFILVFAAVAIFAGSGFSVDCDSVSSCRELPIVENRADSFRQRTISNYILEPALHPGHDPVENVGVTNSEFLFRLISGAV